MRASPRGWALGEVQAYLTALGAEVEPALGYLKCLDLKFFERVFGNVLIFFFFVELRHGSTCL